MEEEKKHMDELIVTYLTEGLDKNALAELKAWIAASTENENYFIQQREVWFSAVSREAALKYNKDKAFDTFKNRIESRKEVEKTSRRGIPSVGFVALCSDCCIHTCSRLLLLLAGRCGCKKTHLPISP